MSITNNQVQNQEVETIQVANGETKNAYRAGFTGKERSLMIATYGTFGKDYMTVDDAIQFANYAIADHLREIDNLKILKNKKLIEKYSQDESELETILELIKNSKVQKNQDAEANG